MFRPRVERWLVADLRLAEWRCGGIRWQNVAGNDAEGGGKRRKKGHRELFLSAPSRSCDEGSAILFRGPPRGGKNGGGKNGAHLIFPLLAQEIDASHFPPFFPLSVVAEAPREGNLGRIGLWKGLDVFSDWSACGGCAGSPLPAQSLPLALLSNPLVRWTIST